MSELSNAELTRALAELIEVMKNLEKRISLVENAFFEMKEILERE